MSTPPTFEALWALVPPALRLEPPRIPPEEDARAALGSLWLSFREIESWPQVAPKIFPTLDAARLVLDQLMRFEGPLSAAEEAVRKPGWQLPNEKPFEYDPEELCGTRSLVRLWTGRARARAALEQWEECLRDFELAYRLSAHMFHGATLAVEFLAASNLPALVKRQLQEVLDSEPSSTHAAALHAVREPFLFSGPSVFPQLICGELRWTLAFLEGKTRTEELLGLIGTDADRDTLDFDLPSDHPQPFDSWSTARLLIEISGDLLDALRLPSVDQEEAILAAIEKAWPASPELCFGPASSPSELEAIQTTLRTIDNPIGRRLIQYLHLFTPGLYRPAPVPEARHPFF